MDVFNYLGCGDYNKHDWSWMPKDILKKIQKYYYFLQFQEYHLVVYRDITKNFSDNRKDIYLHNYKTKIHYEGGYTFKHYWFDRFGNQYLNQEWMWYVLAVIEQNIANNKPIDEPLFEKIAIRINGGFNNITSSSLIKLATVSNSN